MSWIAAMSTSSASIASRWSRPSSSCVQNPMCTCSVDTRTVDSATGVRLEQTVVLASLASASVYLDALRKVSYVDAKTGKRLVLLTNNFAQSLLAIAKIYKKRWAAELFFKWIK